MVKFEQPAIDTQINTALYLTLGKKVNVFELSTQQLLSLLIKSGFQELCLDKSKKEIQCESFEFTF